MKMFRLYIAAAVFAVAAIAFGAPTQVSAEYTNQADIDIVEKATDAFTAFADESNNPSSTVTLLDIKAQAAASALRDVASHSFYNGGSKYLLESATLKQQATVLANEVEKAGEVIETGDNEQISTYFANLEEQAGKFEDQMALVSSAVEESNNSTSNLYLYGLIAAGVVAVAAFAWAFIRPRGMVQPHHVAKARRLVAFASLAPLAGMAITYLGFEYSGKQGGTYYVTWGLVVFGLVWFLGSIIEYNKVRMDGPAKSHKNTPPTPPAASV